MSGISPTKRRKQWRERRDGGIFWLMFQVWEISQALYMHINEWGCAQCEKWSIKLCRATGHIKLIMYTCNRFITTGLHYVHVLSNPWNYNPWYWLMQYIKSCKVDSVWLENLSTPDMFQIQTWDDQGIHFLCKWRQVNFLLPGAKVNGELPCPYMSPTHRLPLLKLSTNLFIAKSNKGWQMIHAVKEHNDFRAAIATLANPWWRRKMTTKLKLKLEVTKWKITKNTNHVW